MEKFYNNAYLFFIGNFIYVIFLLCIIRRTHKLAKGRQSPIIKLSEKIKRIFIKTNSQIISIKYKVISKIEKISNIVRKFFKKSKAQLFFFLFYIPYIAFFVFLVIFQRMQEADVAFKYIIFPLYFAVPILFKSAFEQLEELTDRLEEQADIKNRNKKKGGNFATDSTIKSTMRHLDLSKDVYEFSGIPIIYDGGKNAFVEDSESHSLIIGSTGCGKTRRIVLPLINVLSKKSESFIATDPKGELYSATRDTLEKMGYKIFVLNFRNPLDGNSWNPLHLPYKYYQDGNVDKAVELLNDLGNSIFANKVSGDDSFWSNSSIDYFIGLALALFEDAEREQEVNFNSIYNMSRVGEKVSRVEKVGDHARQIRIIEDYFELHGENSLASISASGTVHAPNDTRGGILSTFQQGIRIYNANSGLSKMLANSDFNLFDIVNEKTAVFVIIQDEKSTYHPLASAFLKQSYEELVHMANSYPKGSLPKRINYILDEFANLPQIADMDNIITASRSRNIRMYLIIQGIKQLNSVYGDNVAEVIKGNCDYWYYMMSKELTLLKEISELCGTRQDDSSLLNINTPLVSVTDLQLLKIGEVLVLQKRLPPYLAKMHDISKYMHFTVSEDVLVPKGTMKRSPEIFSIKMYVEKTLKKKIEVIEKQLKEFEEEENRLKEQTTNIK